MKWFSRNRPYREENIPPPLHGELWLLGALALVILPQILQQPLWIGASCLAILGWRVAKTLKQWPLPGTVVRLVMVAGLLVSAYLQFRTFNGLEAGSAVLTIMLCLKLVELKSMRDAMVVVFLGYFLVIANFLFDQSMLSGAYLFLAVLALTSALIALNHPGGHSRQHLKLAGSLLLQAIPLMLVLFVLFPRIPGPLWALPTPDKTGKTGLSDEMSFGEITNLAESEEVAFRVEFTGEPPPAQQLYWRGPVLWRTDGRNWRSIADSHLLTTLPPTPGTQLLGEPIDYTITLEPHDRRWLFALDLPGQTLPNALLRFDYQLLAKEKISEVFRYTMRSYPAYRTAPPRQISHQLGLQLPDDQNPKTRQLAQQWLAESANPRQVMERALNYIRQQPFYYTRQPPALLAQDAVDEFLFDSRRGFCEHYAASFVILMRSAGIPARVVTGYQGGEMNPLGDYLVVRQSDAHAWAEVWLDDEGWVRVDPTAAIPPERVERFTDLQRFDNTLAENLLRHDLSWATERWLQLRQNWDAMNHQWNQWVLGYGPEKQQQLLERLGLGGLGWGKVLLVMLGLMLALLGLVAALVFLRQARATDPVARHYQRFCRKLAKQGIERQPWEGPEAFARRAAEKLPQQAAQIDAITRLYIGLRYAPGGDGDWRRLASQVRGFRY